MVVVGLGPGGEATATELAKAGLSVVGVDERLVGGECPYFGCIPSKMVIRAANLLADGRRIDGIAGSADVRPDWAPVHARIRDEATDDWDDTVAVKRLVEPEEVASLVLYLCRDEAAAITGANLSIDGGWTAQ